MSQNWRRPLIALLFLGILGLLTAKLGSLALFAFKPVHPDSKEQVLVSVKSGQSPIVVSKNLEDQGIVTSSRKLLRLGKWLRRWKAMKVGEYQFSPSMTPLEVLDVLTAGISVQIPLTIREGQNMFEVAADLEKKGFGKQRDFVRLFRSRALLDKLGFSENVPSLEGYLFPETYFLNRSLSSKEIIQLMVRAAAKVWTQEQVDRAQSLNLSRHQVVTLASIVEKETGAAHERPLISSVFHNRLRKRMRLESDPTTIYGIWETFNGNLRRRHLREKTPYNTYSIRGLPIGPIGNPGREAIQAALFPQTSDYLYFVSKNDGTHQFSRTFKEHKLAVRKFQLDPRARRGKSWRDLDKKMRANTNQKR